jgi:uncharacterized membrane protein
MIMSPRLRKFALTAHITVSVGWIGAVIGYLALVATTMTSKEEQMVRSAYLAMEQITWLALVPLALASLVTGIVMSLGTQWGLFQHYWVVAKLLLTVLSTTVMLSYTKTVSFLADVAADPSADFGRLQGGGGLLHPGVGLLVLLLIVILSVYKPKGMTRYGWRKQQERRKASQS